MTASEQSSTSFPERRLAGATTSKSLENDTVVVADASGELSMGITSECLDAGAQVVVPASSESQIEAFRDLEVDGGGGLRLMEDDLYQPGAPDEFRKKVMSQYGSVDMVVASIGRWQADGQSLARTDPKTFASNHATVPVHFNLAQSFIPALHGAGGGTYAIVNRRSSDVGRPIDGLIKTVSAAKRELTHSFVLENLERQPESARVIELSPESSYQETHADFERTATKVGEMAVAVANDPDCHGDVVHI